MTESVKREISGSRSGDSGAALGGADQAAADQAAADQAAADQAAKVPSGTPWRRQSEIRSRAGSLSAKEMPMAAPACHMLMPSMVPATPCSRHTSTDRQRWGEGKSGSGRVDLGWRRNI